MRANWLVGFTGRWFAYGAGLAVAVYGTYVAHTWLRYGHVMPPREPEERDALLDRFVPAYEVVERHQVRVNAPAAMTFAAAYDMDLQQSAVVWAVFKAREWIMGSHRGRLLNNRGLVPQMREIGWGVLAEIAGRQIVLGSVTQPWKGDPIFRATSPEQFVMARDPDYVKIVWTLRADSIGPAESIFRTETRVATCDRAARIKFRRYWSFVSPGVILIRWIMLGPLKAEAERRWRDAGPHVDKAEIYNSSEVVYDKHRRRGS